MTLYLHRAERADRLVTALGDLLSNPLPDAFATEIISVPTPGVERWLSQGLAQRLGAAPGRSDGVCVGVDFPSPRRLVARALAGSADEEDIDPWQPHRAVWPLLRVIDGCRGEPWAALLWHHLGGRSNELDPVGLAPSRAGRRWSIARHLAGIFAMYAATRPTMIDAWSEGRDVDPAGSPLPPTEPGRPSSGAGCATSLVCRARSQRLQSRSGQAPASSRRAATSRNGVSVFGATRLDPDHLLVLSALADHRDVHLWLAHPSPALWTSVEAAIQGNGIGPTHMHEELTGPRRADDATEALVRHRLLAYLGRDVRELQLALTKISPNATDCLTRHSIRLSRHRCSVGCSPTSRQTRRRGRRASDHCSTRTTKACSSTPATAPIVR